jgi:hypothetical protein
MSENSIRFSDKMKPKKTTSAIQRRIRAHGRGWVFTPVDFLDLGTRDAVDQTLSRLTKAHVIRRLTQGIYDYPRVHGRLGILGPDPDKVAAVLAAKTGSRVQVSGARAANLLGLSDQVPAQFVYLTDGRTRRIKIVGQPIHLKHTAPSKFPGVGTTAGLAIQAIRALGPNADKDFVIRQLDRSLTIADKQQLAKLRQDAPDWSRDIITRLTTTT